MGVARVLVLPVYRKYWLYHAWTELSNAEQVTPQTLVGRLQTKVCFSNDQMHPPQMMFFKMHHHWETVHLPPLNLRQSAYHIYSAGPAEQSSLCHCC